MMRTIFPLDGIDWRKRNGKENRMCNSSTITKIYKGSWMEILSHREEIPDISEVQLIVYSERKEDDEEEQARLHQNLNQLFEEADRKEFTPTKEEIRDVNLELDK